MSSINSGLCENVRGDFLSLDDIFEGEARCQRQKRRPGLVQEDLVVLLAPNSADRRWAAACTILE